MPHNIVHFDIQADLVERARRFYERVFGWRFEPWGPPDFYLIRTGTAADPGIHGSLSKRNQPVAGHNRIGYECTISVKDLSAIKTAILANGGKSLQVTRRRLWQSKAFFMCSQKCPTSRAARSSTVRRSDGNSTPTKRMSPASHLAAPIS